MFSRTFCPLKKISAALILAYSSFPANSKLTAQYALPYYHLTLKVVKMKLNRNCRLNSRFAEVLHTILQGPFSNLIFICLSQSFIRICRTQAMGNISRILCKDQNTVYPVPFLHKLRILYASILYLNVFSQIVISQMGSLQYPIVNN